MAVIILLVSERGALVEVKIQRCSPPANGQARARAGDSGEPLQLHGGNNVGKSTPVAMWKYVLSLLACR